VSQDRHKFFGTLDLSTPVSDGVALAVGVRNSTDQTFPLGSEGPSKIRLYAGKSHVSLTPQGTGWGRSAGKAGNSRNPQRLHA